MTTSCRAISPGRWLHALGQALIAALLLLSSAPLRGQIAGPIPKLPPVQKITLQHIGQAAASDALIRANIRLKLGDPYSHKASDDDKE